MKGTYVIAGELGVDPQERLSRRHNLKTLDHLLFYREQNKTKEKRKQGRGGGGGGGDLLAHVTERSNEVSGAARSRSFNNVIRILSPGLLHLFLLCCLHSLADSTLRMVR